MLLSDALELAIGLTFIFFLFSLTTTAVLEFLESFTRTRASKLLDGMKELLGDPKVLETGQAAVEAIYGHPLVQGLYRGDFQQASAQSRLPSYVPTRNFALALMDQVIAGKMNPAPSNATLPRAASASLSDRLHLAAERIANEHLRRAILQAVQVGGDDANRVRQHLEQWYDGAMDRVSGWYKRRSQMLLFVLGLVGALAININTLTIAEELAKNATLRRAVATEAERPDNKTANASETVAAIDRLGLPIGWTQGAVDALLHPLRLGENTNGWWTVLGALQIALGYGLTAFAISLGSPFWFDVLNRLMVIRETVKPHEKSPEEGSEDKPGSGKTLTIVTKSGDADPAAQPVPVADRPIDNEIYASPPIAGEKPFEEWYQ